MRNLSFLLLLLSSACAPDSDALENVGELCVDGSDALWVVFDTCVSSGTVVEVSDCTAEEQDGEWVVTTQYLEGEQGAVTDCVVIDAPCPSPNDPDMPVRLGEDEAVALTALPACTDTGSTY